MTLNLMAKRSKLCAAGALLNLLANAARKRDYAIMPRTFMSRLCP